MSRLAGPGLGLLATVLLVSLLAPGESWERLALAIVAASPALALLGARGREPMSSWSRAGAAVSFLLVGGGFVALVSLSAGDPVSRTVLGLPAALGVLVWVLAVGTLTVLGLIFAISFAARRPSDAEIGRLRELAERADDE